MFINNLNIKFFKDNMNFVIKVAKELVLGNTYDYFIDLFDSKP